MLIYELQTYYWTGMCVESYIPVQPQNLSEFVRFRTVICHPLHLLSLAVCVSRALCWELCSARRFRLVAGAGVLVLALEWPRATVAEVEVDCCRCLENKATRGGGVTRRCRPFLVLLPPLFWSPLLERSCVLFGVFEALITTWYIRTLSHPIMWYERNLTCKAEVTPQRWR